MQKLSGISPFDLTYSFLGIDPKEKKIRCGLYTKCFIEVIFTIAKTNPKNINNKMPSTNVFNNKMAFNN